MKKIIITLLVTIFSFGLIQTSTNLFAIESTYAQDTGAPATGDPAADPTEDPATTDNAPAEDEENRTLDEVADAARSVLIDLQSLFGIILYFLNFLLWPVLMMIGGLMDNSLIFGPGMEDRLLSVWAQVRNIVNLAFVLVLVGMALYNVLGIGEEGNYTIKKMLPKFIFALMLVNFSFIASKVVLDAANVMTDVVFSLPNSVENEFNITKVEELERALCSTLDNLSGINVDTAAAEEGGFQMCANKNSFTATAREFFETLSANNIALVMAVNLGQIHKGLTVSELVLKDPTLTNLTINIIFSIVMFVVYAAAYISLFFVLLARVVVLWLIIAMSPFIALKTILPEGATSSFGNTDFKDVFLKHAIAPIVIGFGMSLGYIMLDAYQRTSTAALGIELGADFANSFSGTSDLQQLIIAAAAVAVVWKVTFTAASDTIASGITESIKSGLARQGKWFASLPLALPALPTASQFGNNASVIGLRDYLRRRQSDFERRGQIVDSNNRDGNSTIRPPSNVRASNQALSRNAAPYVYTSIQELQRDAGNVRPILNDQTRSMQLFQSVFDNAVNSNMSVDDYILLGNSLANAGEIDRGNWEELRDLLIENENDRSIRLNQMSQRSRNALSSKYRGVTGSSDTYFSGDIQNNSDDATTTEQREPEPEPEPEEADEEDEDDEPPATPPTTP